jgi:hypothetical protein
MRIPNSVRTAQPREGGAEVYRDVPAGRAEDVLAMPPNPSKEPEP